MAETQFARANGVRIAYERVGSGFPVLLVHGWPQSRRMWRHIVPSLAERFTVVSADLRGYGASDPGPTEASYDKRTMSEDLLALMQEIGLGDRFLVVGHDRGARVARRMAADHPDRLVGAALLDIMPMEWVYDQGQPTPRAYYHWYFFLQRGLAEEVLTRQARAFALHHFNRTQVPLDPADVEHYIQLFERPHSITATLGDYRTAFEVDRPRWKGELDAGRRVQVPLLLLWGDSGGLKSQPVLEEWARCAISVRGRAITHSGHYVAEEQPQQVLDAVLAFADELHLP